MNLGFHNIRPSRHNYRGLKNSKQQYSCDIYWTFMTDGSHNKVHDDKNMTKQERKRQRNDLRGKELFIHYYHLCIINTVSIFNL